MEETHEMANSKGYATAVPALAACGAIDRLNVAQRATTTELRLLEEPAVAAIGGTSAKVYFDRGEE
jgi:hypothetical protein